MAYRGKYPNRVAQSSLYWYDGQRFCRVKLNSGVTLRVPATGEEPRRGAEWVEQPGQSVMPGAHMKGWTAIIRAIHERGAAQLEALHELASRGLFLSAEQAAQAGVTRQQAGLGPA